MGHERRTRDPPRLELRIKADDDVAKGRFANLAQVGSSHDSFVVDFAFVQGSDGWLLSRILLSPSHAKRFHTALAEAIARHEQRFGPIEPTPTLQ
ncbi:MAG: DUF3467 domain-containing protein [Sandaracinaceae bacterium]|nr:DUF3467 domain-containing protein [Sandaracinaceae bacterium]